MSDKREIKVNKNPYRNKKFTRVVKDFEKQGLKQLSLEDELDKLISSEAGEYFRQKNIELDKSKIVSRGIHGISHSNRVAILAMLIGQREGTFENDIDNRIKDILLSSAYYHDIGRKKGPIVVSSGPHAKSSARKVNKMNLAFLDGKQYSEEEKRMVQAIVEAHEGRDEDMDAICKKYKISDSNIKITKELMTIIKDADALDRARLDFGLPLTKPDLNPDFLRTNSAKELINVAYELEALSKSASMEEIIDSRLSKTKTDEIETFAGIFEKVKIDNYKLYNEKYQREGKIDFRKSFYRYFK